MPWLLIFKQCAQNATVVAGNKANEAKVRKNIAEGYFSHANLTDIEDIKAVRIAKRCDELGFWSLGD